MAEYSNAKQSIYSDLEPDKENIYSQPEDVDSDHSDKGSVSGRGSDRGSVGRRNGSSDHGHHDDRDGDRSDREDDLSDRGSRRSDHGSRQSDQGSRRSDHGSRQSDHGSRRSDREDGRSDSHSTHDREGSLRDSVDGSRDRRDSSHDGAGDVYEALDEMNDLVTQAEQNLYINNEDDRKSNDSHSDGEGEGHLGRRGSAVGDAEAIYEEVRERQSDSDDGSEKGGHGKGHGRHSDDLYDDVRAGHARENGHQQHRRGSRDSDDENHRSRVDGGLKRQTSSNAPTSSGKFMLRTSRKADALHVLRRIRDSSSAEDNPEMDELVTVLRSTDHSSKHDDVMDEENEKIKSFITSKLIHKFEQGIASEDVFNENHDNHSIATNHSQINDRPNTTVVKTTVVKTTPKVDATSPVSSKGHHGIPKSPTSPVAAAVYGSGVASNHSHTSSSSSSLSSAPQIHQTSVTHQSHGPNSGVITKTTTTTVTGLHVNATPSRHPVNELPKTPDESGVLGWKADIEMRKKTKSHVPTQRPKEPMKMSEVPEWKKQLQEKNKMKKLSSSDESDITITRVATVEMGRVKHEKMVITHGHGGRADNVPEWVRLADEKQKTISH